MEASENYHTVLAIISYINDVPRPLPFHVLVLLVCSSMADQINISSGHSQIIVKMIALIRDSGLSSTVGSESDCKYRGHEPSHIYTRFIQAYFYYLLFDSSSAEESWTSL